VPEDVWPEFKVRTGAGGLPGMGRMRSSPPNDNDRHVAELALLSVVSAEAVTLCCQRER
jgi:hypothetical protein